MSFYSLLLVAIALSLDAFGVAISIGLNNSATKKFKIYCILAFSIFQFLFSLIGGYSGFLFNQYVMSVPEKIGGTIIALVGVMMLKEGMTEKEEVMFIKPGMWLILGVSVSIDAMVVGFTVLSNITSYFVVFKDSVFIGIVTFFMTGLAFYISKYLKKIYVISKYSDYIGGTMLILFGLKMIFL